MSDFAFVSVDFLAGFAALFGFCAWQFWDLRQARNARAKAERPQSES